jgi:hypothetical protein
MHTIYTDGAYRELHPSWHVKDSPWKAGQIMRAFARANISARTICEVGCGAGEVLRQLQMQLPPDTQLCGYEISPDAYAMCKERQNERLHFCLADLATTEAHFDVLLIIDVIEHVEDCFGFLRALQNKATYTICHIPLDLTVHGLVRHHLMHYRRELGHIHYFTKNTALALLRDAGYTVLDWAYTPVLDSAKGKGALTATIQRATFRLSPDWSALVLGGRSLMVVAQ